MKTLASILVLLFLSACSSMHFVPASEQSTPPIQSSHQTTVVDEQGNIIVRSGSHRDLRRGYYFDTKEGRCIEVTYSTGPGCIPPPYETIEECMADR
ncbi:hypothetical protein [Draconibacterium orientale]|uniref:hypothetical protein n=1 Tax=Draconibacterium orientale TaxID=1168034 RepID=UPI002ABD3528|nr:hypothetical protein [Draconibacterium orientale]